MFSSVEIEILRDLYLNPEGERIYHFYSKYNLSPEMIANMLLLYKDFGFIDILDNRATLTIKGRKWVFANRKAIFLTKRDMFWKNVNSDDQTETYEKLSINKLYLPRVNKIDTELIKRKEKKARNGNRN